MPAGNPLPEIDEDHISCADSERNIACNARQRGSHVEGADAQAHAVYDVPAVRRSREADTREGADTRSTWCTMELTAA